MRRRADFKINPCVFDVAGNRLRGGLHRSVDVLPDPRAVRHVEHLRQGKQHPLHIGMGFGLQRQNRQAQGLQALTATRRARQQHQIGLLRDHCLYGRVQSATEFGQGQNALRVVGITVNADQARATAQLANRLCQRRQQTDDALRRFVQRHGYAAVVFDLQGQHLGASHLQCRSQRQRAQKLQPAFDGLIFQLLY